MRSDSSPEGRSGSFIEAARRAQIIQAATETVAELGYANASLARIAERAGISKSVISYHFAGKDDLLSQLVHRLFDDGWTAMQEIVYAEPSPSGQLHAWIREQLRFFAQHRTRFLAMAEVVAHHRPADGSQPFADAMGEEIIELTRILEEGQQTGELRAFDARAYAQIISQAIEGLLERWAVDPSTDLVSAADVLVDFVDHAVRGGQT